MFDINLLFLKKKSNPLYFMLSLIFKKKHPHFLNHTLSPTKNSEKLLKDD